MSFDDLEDAQDEAGMPRIPDAVPLGRRIAGANWMPGNLQPDIRPDITVGGEEQEPPSTSGIGQRIVDQSTQQWMPSRDPRPDPSQVLPMLAGPNPEQQRRVLDGLLRGMNDPQDTSTARSVQSNPLAGLAQQAPSRIQGTPQAPPATPPAGQTPGQPQPARPNQTAPGSRNPAGAHHRGHNQAAAPPVHNLEEQLQRDEGNRRVPYRDSRGHWTVGVGHNLDANNEQVPGGPITDQQIQNYLQQDVQTATRDVNQALPWASNLDDARRGVLLNMTFNMGIGNATEGTGLLGFQHMLTALQNRDYERAAREMLNADWARQVGNSPPSRRHPEGGRAWRLAQQMRTGQWH